jgi:hypothetical protein
MKHKNLLTVALLALGLSTVVMAADTFKEDYKVEKPVKTDRQIASEKESEREPSSVNAPAPDEAADESPRPWLTKLEGSTH